MATEQLKEFLREKKARATPPGFDWSARRDAWIEAVSHLYDAIERKYLGVEDLTGVVEVDRTQTKTIHEPPIEPYWIDELVLTVGDEQVRFSPKGTIILGAMGRVDVQGDRGEATLVRGDDDRWSLVASRSPRVELLPLNDESFLKMLRDVMR